MNENEKNEIKLRRNIPTIRYLTSIKVWKGVSEWKETGVDINSQHNWLVKRDHAPLTKDCFALVQVGGGVQ